MAIDPPHVVFNVQPAHQPDLVFLGNPPTPQRIPLVLDPGQTIRPGQLVKRRTDLNTGQVMLVPYDGLGQAEGYISEHGNVLPYQNYETCSIPRAMVTHPHLYQKDSIAGALYRRDLLAGLDDHVVYMRNLDFLGAQSTVASREVTEANERFVKWLTL